MPLYKLDNGCCVPMTPEEEAIHNAKWDKDIADERLWAKSKVKGLFNEYITSVLDTLDAREAELKELEDWEVTLPDGLDDLENDNIEAYLMGTQDLELPPRNLEPARQEQVDEALADGMKRYAKTLKDLSNE